MKQKTISVDDKNLQIHISNLGAYNEMRFIIDNEISVIEDILHESKKKDTFLDVGANMGAHSISVDKKIETVYSIEPHPVNLSHLSINSQMNNSDIDIFACGLSDSKGYLEIDSPEQKMKVDGSASTGGASNTEKAAIAVRLEKGDEFIRQNGLNIPQIIKIDVEGSEMSVLRGLKTTIEHADCRVVYCEVHDNKFEEIKQFFNSSGYDTNIIGHDRIIKAMKGQK